MKVRHKINGVDVSPDEFSAGAEDRLVDMLSSGRPPSANTDREFLEGHCNGNQFEKKPEIGDRLAADARAVGVNVKGKIYIGGLAAYPGDPRAWVSDRSDVERVCQEMNYGCDGSVKRKADQGRGEPDRMPKSLPGDEKDSDPVFNGLLPAGESE
jgi:hypothetical protein